MIYINGRFLLQNQTGVNRFAYEICKALTLSGVDFTLLCPNGEIKECYNTDSFRIKHLGSGKSHFWEQVILPIKWTGIKGKKLLISFTGLGPIFIKEKVITIHDLAFMVNPKWYSFSYRALYRLLTPLSAYTSKKTITVSEFSKKEIIHFLQIKEENIEVIYNAVSKSLIPNTHNDTTNNKKYILAVSSIDPRKNFQKLLEAFTKLKNEDTELYIIGGQNSIYNTSIDILRQKNGINNRIKWLGRVSDLELQEYYQNATCFIYPSLYEGFGIPPIEAMANGCPTIVSNIPPLREVCQDAAIYINPNDINDIAEKIDLVIENQTLQETLRHKGYKQYKKFNWEESANKIVRLVKKMYEDTSTW